VTVTSTNGGIEGMSAGGPVAQRRRGSGGEERGLHPSRVTEGGVPDGVDAAEHGDEAAVPHSVFDRVRAHAERDQLLASHYPVLARGERRRGAIDGNV
jgi:hypothetical protein